MSLPDHLKLAIETYVPPLEGGDWADLGRRCDIAELVIENKPKVVVEIGTFGGAGALPIAFALRENNDGGKLFCLDPWRVDYAIEGEWKDNQDWWTKNIVLDDIHQKCMHAIWAHNIDNWLVVIRAASQHVHQLFPEIDMLIIDGNHSEVASLRDAELYAPKVVSGGLILADDCDWNVKIDETTQINSTAKAMKFIEVSSDLVKQIGNMRIYRKR